MQVTVKTRLILTLLIFITAGCAGVYKRSDEVAQYRQSMNANDAERVLTSLMVRGPTNGGVCRIGLMPVVAGSGANAGVKVDYPIITLRVLKSEFAGTSISGDVLKTYTKEKMETYEVNIERVGSLLITESEENCNRGLGGYLAYIGFASGGIRHASAEIARDRGIGCAHLQFSGRNVADQRE